MHQLSARSTVAEGNLRWWGVRAKAKILHPSFAQCADGDVPVLL